MTAMIERCARAIYEKRNGAGCVPWSRRSQAHKDPYLFDARAAIEAMREPHDDIADAMNDVAIDGPAYIDFYPSLSDCKRLFNAGIYAALHHPATDEAAV